MYGSGVAVVVVYRAVLCVGRRGGHISQPRFRNLTRKKRNESVVE